MATKAKTVCKFGAGCYRKNPKHLSEYSHPADEEEKKSPSPAKATVKTTTKPEKRKTTLDDYFGKGDKPAKKAKKEEKAEDSWDDEAGPSKSPSPSPSKSTESPQKEETPKKDEAAAKEEIEDDGDIPASPADVKESIKQKFLVEMPDDFYDFWEFAKSINSKKPTDALLNELGLQLVGPYDVLAGTAHNKHPRTGRRVNYLRHWRYFYDPPEFLTVLKGNDKTQYHMGYYRDDPKELPVFVASNEAKENCKIRPRGPNIFATVSAFIDDALRKDKSSRLKKLKESVRAFAAEKGHTLETRTAEMKAREKKVVTRSFHAAGIVVPVDAHDVGYRELPETDADLKKLFKKIADAKDEQSRNEAMDPLMEIVMLVQFANDECDYGEGLELAIDMFCSGHDVLHKSVLNMMPLAYQLLNREPFGRIITEHLKDRKHTAKLSQLE